ncbi:MAG: S9 family peptidase [Candidatus Aminicenantales bacterium]
MRIAPFRLRRSLFFCWMLACAVLAAAQAQTGGKVLTLADYPLWKQFAGAAISPDGGWFASVLKPNGGDETLTIRSLSSDRSFAIPGGTTPEFSRDSKWAAYAIVLPKAEAEALRKDKKPVPRKIELLGLASGEKFTVENGADFAFSNDSKSFVVRKPVPEGEPGGAKGVDAIFRRLDQGTTQLVGNVGEHAFNKPGGLWAYTVDVEGRKGNGLYLLEPATGRLDVLDSGEMEYSRLSWDREGTAIAVLKGTKKKGFSEKDNVLVAFTGLMKRSGGPRVPPARFEYDPSGDPSFPKGMVLSERGEAGRRFGPGTGEAETPVSWSEDLSRIFCGIKEQDKEPEESKEPVANVDVWHWRDDRIQSAQMIQAERDRNFTWRSVFLTKEKRFLRLADATMKTVRVARDGRWGLGRDDKPYFSDIEQAMADYYAVDTATGTRRPIVQGVRRELGESPDGRRFLYMKDRQVFLYSFDSGKTENIAEKAGVIFADEEDDHPEEKPAYGLAGWTKDGKAVILNHRYDLWLLPFDGGAPRNITRGLGDREEIRFRCVRLDPEERAIDTSKPLLLSAYGEWTKKAGFYSLRIGAPPVRLVFEDKLFGPPVKARSADRVVYTAETFVDSPDYYISGTDFAAPRKITDANPQQAGFAWGSRRLVDFTNGRGRKLQASLTYPAGYEPGTRYPMIVYIYEKVSQQHHKYSMPTYDDRPHMSAYASDGYFVLMPDIAFEIGKPGSSALDCVSAAVAKVLELGVVDPKRIGLQGHSWGGFETAFIITQTDLFACAVAGAAPSSVAIEFNQVFKGSGENNHSYYERSQGRMGTNPWKDPALFDSQSAIRQAANIRVPFLLLHGTIDGSVDWIESLEYYNAARRLGKEVIFLSYPGEDHHLAREENQKDFLLKMKQYFDRYLKGAEAPDWMTKGVPFLKKAYKEKKPGGGS